MSVTRNHHRHITPFGLVLLLTFSAACGSGEPADTPVPAEGAAATPAAAVTASDGYVAADKGQGSVSWDGVQHDNFRGDCQLSRMNGREEVGDLGNLDGVKLTVGIDNDDANTMPEMSFVAFSSLDFAVTRDGQRTRGTLRTIASESALTPKGASQAMAKVAFTGQTDEGVPVVARVVCEIQNKF